MHGRAAIMQPHPRAAARGGRIKQPHLAHLPRQGLMDAARRVIACRLPFLVILGEISRCPTCGVTTQQRFQRTALRKPRSRKWLNLPIRIQEPPRIAINAEAFDRRADPINFSRRIIAWRGAALRHLRRGCAFRRVIRVQVFFRRQGGASYSQTRKKDARLPFRACYANKKRQG